MQEPYEFIGESWSDEFTFVSTGPKGNIGKYVRFERHKFHRNVYSLALADVNPFTGNASDQSRTNNGDMYKVLTTVAKITLRFLRGHPNATIIARGSTAARTRLYRMGISRNYDVIAARVTVMGYCHGDWHHFEHDVPYDHFIIEAKPK